MSRLTRARHCAAGLSFGVLAVLAVLSMGGCKGPIDEKNTSAFVAKLGDTSVTVFPAFVRRGPQTGHDAAAAVTLAAMLTENNLARAQISTSQVPISRPSHMNQSQTFRESLQALGEHVRSNPIDTEYAMMSEYLMGRGGAGGVHLYVVDRAGVPVYGVLLNSHHDPFTKADPKTVDDCSTLVAAVARDELCDLRRQAALR